MMKNRRFPVGLTGVCIMLAAISCKNIEQAATRVYPLDSTQIPEIRNGIIYGLPKTKLVFRIRVKEKITLPGPYHEFGEELLGISNIPQNEKRSWEITGIRIDALPELDYNRLYAIEPRGSFHFEWSKFADQGWIIPFDTKYSRNIQEKTDFYGKRDIGDMIPYKDLSVSKFAGKETKTVYKRVWKDSIYARIPVQETQVIEKDIDQKAQEAANFIFMIREKRFELISGMGDYYPEGEAMKAALNEMSRLEENYLSLFTGTQLTDSFEYTVTWIPEPENLREPVLLFRFSHEEGVLKQSQNKGIPIWLEMDTPENPEVIIEKFKRILPSTTEPRLYYRIPVHAVIRLKSGDQLLAKRNTEIFQFGPVLQIPWHFLKDSRIIDFYPETEK